MDLDRFTRFGVYFTAPRGPLAEFGASWLGWDVAAGNARPHPEIAGLPQPISTLTATPRRYGFHATLKPPFRLEPHSTPETALVALEVLAAERDEVVLDGLEVSQLGAFVALTPVGDVAALNALAAAIVKGMDQFRAPPSPAELAKRRGSGLTPEQDALLLKWGYPFVLGQFRFHMTLTGRLTEHEATEVRRVLTPRFAPLVPGQVRIDALTFVGEDTQGRFHVIRRLPLGGGRSG